MKTSRSLIFSPAKEIERQRKPRSKRQRWHYDNGMPIDLHYDSGYYAAEPVKKAQSMSASSSDVFARPFADSAPGSVESFENSEDNSDEQNT